MVVNLEAEQLVGTAGVIGLLPQHAILVGIIVEDETGAVFIQLQIGEIRLGERLATEPRRVGYR